MYKRQDLLYGASKYPSGLLRPDVVRGHFEKNDFGDVQQLFYHQLLDGGFRRTPWQLVFPGQTAGIVMRIDQLPSGVNECHVRFYGDGTIDPELEVHRWGSTHWSGPRESGIEYVLTHFDVSPDAQVLLGHMGYSSECTRDV